MACGSRALAPAAATAAVGPGVTAGDLEIEIHGGGLWAFTPSSGQATRLPRGETLQTVLPIAMDAQPSVTTGTPASADVASSTIGAIQFVNNGSGPYQRHRSSLSGPSIAGLETLRGTGC